MGTLSKYVVSCFIKYPVLRGMASYAIIWPVSSLIQQTFEGKNIGNYDWWRCACYGLYGSCYVAPTIYTWLTVASYIFPGTSITSNLAKVITEQFTYAPIAITSFYFGMSILELKTIDEAVAEVKLKFWPTYKLGVCVWPSIAMFNFCLIPPKNRVPFISMCSLIWTSYLAYMKSLVKENVHNDNSPFSFIKK